MSDNCCVCTVKLTIALGNHGILCQIVAVFVFLVCHDIAEILLKFAFSTNQSINHVFLVVTMTTILWQIILVIDIPMPVKLTNFRLITEFNAGFYISGNNFHFFKVLGVLHVAAMVFFIPTQKFCSCIMLLCCHLPPGDKIVSMQ